MDVKEQQKLMKDVLHQISNKLCFLSGHLNLLLLRDASLSIEKFKSITDSMDNAISMVEKAKEICDGC